MSERIYTRCAACGNDTLTINGGHLLCTWHECPDPTIMDRPTVADRNVNAVRELLKTRAEIGLQKYGVTTERTYLSRIDWLKHAQAEALDLAVYLQRLISEEESK